MVNSDEADQYWLATLYMAVAYPFPITKIKVGLDNTATCANMIT